ncbi:PLP-dependent cysteine synthase family protein [Ferroplasma acidiphilum]|uniref:Cysteine synthase family protein n=1 Tax=Ferroplasma acidiphilum TaxID=74969 RepID=A0A7K4FPB9_9ARCH|nr:cysteine synthase family protein [Ferroplasma acidiphilum]MCL4349290.1 cysteine synthase family protein [Candidatus Thermoplasmatota archaeon]NOL60228.1 cysteine synthase family protein [Ferroplasma acidiphilum]
MDDVRASVLSTIGNTPLVKLNRTGCRNIEIYVKLEYYSPGFSIKDRIAIGMIEDAERKGILKKGDTVIGKTSGNTGIGLAIACAVKGYKFITVMSAGNSMEKTVMLKALGAEVVLVPQQPGEGPDVVSRKDNEAVEKKTDELTEELHAYRPNQYINPVNYLIHEYTTGSEIIKQSDGNIDAFVAFVGTGGTFVGISSALKKFRKDIKCYPVEPDSAQFLAGKQVITTRHKIQGGGHAVKPPYWDESLVDGYLSVTDDEAIDTARYLASKEGIFPGFSGGANVAAAMKLDKTMDRGSIVVTVLPDSGLKYLSSDLYKF